MLRSFNFDFSVESEHPTIESGAGAYTDRCFEMFVIHDYGFKVAAKLIDEILHHRHMAMQLHGNRLIGIIHTEDMFAIVCRSIAFRRHYRNLVKDLRLFRDAIQAEIPHFLTLVTEATHVIVVAVPDQCIRTSRVGFSIICIIALLCHVKICVTEGDFPLGIDSIIDSIDDIISVFIVRFCATGNVNMAAEFRSILLIGQGKKLRYQFIALSLRDELGRRNSINKDLEFRKFINVAVVIVLVLGRLIVPNM